tara:strand:- start:343 stop:639 length:297 start_codon:yes stop_codon:yes gene_type:complete
MQYFHQQLYLFFAALVIVSYICGNFIKSIFLWLLTHAVNVTKSSARMIGRILLNIFNFIKLKVKMGLSKIDEKTKPCTRVIKKKLGMRVPHECEGEEQ